MARKLTLVALIGLITLGCSSTAVNMVSEEEIAGAAGASDTSATSVGGQTRTTVGGASGTNTTIVGGSSTSSGGSSSLGGNSATGGSSTTTTTPGGQASGGVSTTTTTGATSTTGGSSAASGGSSQATGGSSTTTATGGASTSTGGTSAATGGTTAICTNGTFRCVDTATGKTPVDVTLVVTRIDVCSEGAWIAHMNTSTGKPAVCECNLGTTYCDISDVKWTCTNYVWVSTGTSCMSGTGGATGTGGASATGGTTSNTGGTSATGGTPSAGGTSTAGGTTSTGGTSATGGTSNSCTASTTCSNGTLTVTSCPGSVVTSKPCYSACNAAGIACEYSGISKVYDDYYTLALDNDTNFVYASERSAAGASQITRYAKGSNARTVLFQTTDSSVFILNFIVAGNTIYFSPTNGINAGSVWAINKATADQTSPTMLSSEPAFGFAKNSTKVFWSNMPRNACGCSDSSSKSIYVYSVTIDGFEAIQQPRLFAEISPDIEVDDTYLYVWEIQYKGISAYNVALNKRLLSDLNNSTQIISGGYTWNGVTYALTGGVTSLPALTKNSTSTIFTRANIDNGSNSAVFKLTASPAFVILTNLAPWNESQVFAANTSYVYTDNMKVSLNGGTPNYFNSHEIMSITVDDTNVYFGSWGYWNNLPYAEGLSVSDSAIFTMPK